MAADKNKNEPSKNRRPVSSDGRPRTDVCVDATQRDLLDVMQRIVWEEYSPKSIVVNAQGDLLCASADLQKYLAVGVEESENNILKMANQGLRSGMRSMLQQSKSTRRRIVRDDLSIKNGGDLQRVMLTVQPMSEGEQDAQRFMVIFHDVGLPQAGHWNVTDKLDPTDQSGLTDQTIRANPRQRPGLAGDTQNPSCGIGASATGDIGNFFDALKSGASNDDLVAHLRRSLAATRHDLEQSMQELESTNNQLQSSNTDLLSLNEKILSANKELATSKEKVESAVVALTAAKDDLENLLRSTQVATIILDDELKICRFTPAATEIYGLSESDIGRPLAQLVPMADSVPPLPAIANLQSDRSNNRGQAPRLSPDGSTKAIAAADSAKPRHSKSSAHVADVDGSSSNPAPPTSSPIVKEHTFKTHNEKWFRRRVLPYVNQQGRSIGIVLTFIDVTAERKAQQSAIRQQQQLKTLTDNMPALIAYLDADLRHRFVNHAYADQFNSTPGNLIGRSVLSVWGDAHYVDLEEHLEAAISGQRHVFEIELDAIDGGPLLTKEITYAPDFSADGTVNGVYVLAVDVTLRKRWEQVLLDRESYLRQVIDNIGGFVGILETDGTLVDANKAATLAGGIAREEVIGKRFWDCYWWTHDREAAEQLKQAVAKAAGGELVRYDVEVRMANDSRAMIDFMIAPVVDNDGKVIFLIPSGIDIGDRVEAQENAIRRLRQLNLATEVGRLGGWTWDIATDRITWSQRLHELFGYRTDEFDGTPAAFLQIVVAEDRSLVQCVIDDIIEGTLDSFEYECRCIRGSDRRQIWTQVRGVVDRDADGIAIRVTGVAADVTARKRRELALEFQAALQVELTDLKTADEITRVTTSRVSDFLDLSHCVVIDIDGNAETAEVIFDYHRPIDLNGLENRTSDEGVDLRGIYNMSDFWSDQERSALAQGALLAIDNTNDPNRSVKYRENFRSLGIGAIVNAPSNRNQRLAFVLSAIKPAAHQWQPYETELLRELATSLYLRVERARTDAELIANKEQLQLGIEVANFAMGRVDYATDEVSLSAEAAQLYGLGHQPMVVTRDQIHATFEPNDRMELDQCIAASLDPEGDHRISVQHRVRMADGSMKWLSVRKRIFFNHEGASARPSHAILVARDITQQRQFEQSLKEARSMAELANQSKSEFLANMSHEIRTPMTAILGYADILNRHLKDPDNRNCVSIIRNNGQFLLDIINDILDISKIEAGKLELHQSQFRVDQLVADVQSLMQVRATEKNISLQVRYAGSIPETIGSDQKRLKQVLINLVGNAIKFTETGGVTLAIFMETENDQSWLKFAVTDTGIGMSPDQTKKLFHPFTQADSSVDRKFGGTGLGLTISQRIARMLDGDIALTSELGKGSTFTLTIKIAGAGQPTLIQPPPTVGSNQSEAADEVPLTRAKLSGNYLVVDDRREIRFIAQHFIEEAGGRVSIAEDGEEAIAAVARSMKNGAAFDVVVMDMQMPIMDGYQAARQMRKMNYQGPIIALTAHAMDGDREACIQAGCTDYLSKPLDGPQFVNRLASYGQGESGAS